MSNIMLTHALISPAVMNVIMNKLKLRLALKHICKNSRIHAVMVLSFWLTQLTKEKHSASNYE